MTEQTDKTPEQIAAEAAAALEASVAAPAPEAVKEPEAAQAPAPAPADAPEEAVAEFEDAEPEAPANLNALRGIRAGPLPHPRTV